MIHFEHLGCKKRDFSLLKPLAITSHICSFSTKKYTLKAKRLRHKCYALRSWLLEDDKLLCFQQ